MRIVSDDGLPLVRVLKWCRHARQSNKSVCMFISSVFSHSFYIPGFYHRVLV